MGDEPLHDLDNSFVIITEYNRSIQGFLVSHINASLILVGQTYYRRPMVSDITIF